MPGKTRLRSCSLRRLTLAKPVVPAWRSPLAIAGVSVARCAARLVLLRVVPGATGLRRALRRRRSLRCVRRCARSLATFRGSGHAGSDPRPEEDIRPESRADAFGVYVQGQQGARSHPSPAARRAVCARWRGQYLRRQHAAHHRGTGRSEHGPSWSGTRTTRAVPTTRISSRCSPASPPRCRIR